MRINYLLSNVDKEKGFSIDQTNYLKRDIKNNSTIVFISSNFDTNEKNDIYFNKIIEWFNNINIFFKEKYLIDNRINSKTAKQIIMKSDIVYLMGGNPLIQINNINNYNLKDVIQSKKSIIIGVSAGAVNQANEVVYIDETTQERIIKYSGLGLIDVNIYPHFNISDINFVKEVQEVSKHIKTMCLPNESFVRIENNNVEIIGDYYMYDANGKLHKNKENLWNMK